MARKEKTMTKLGFCILHTPDVEKKVAFYERAFGMERKYVSEEKAYGEMKGDIPLGFVAADLARKGVGDYVAARPDAPPLGCEVGFVFDDVDAAFRKAVEAGAQAHHAPEKKPWG